MQKFETHSQLRIYQRMQSLIIIFYKTTYIPRPINDNRSLGKRLHVTCKTTFSTLGYCKSERLTIIHIIKKNTTIINITIYIYIVDNKF